MATTRLPQFKPQYLGKPFNLDERDIEILKTVYEFRAINSNQLKALFFSTLREPRKDTARQTGEGIIRRLNLLYHYGYLDRPREQLSLRKQVGNIPMIYALSDRGAKALREQGMQLKEGAATNSRRKLNNAATYRFLNHQLWVSEYIVTLRLALRDHSRIEFVSWQREQEFGAAKVDIQYQVKTSRGLEMRKQTVRVRPDAIFTLRFTDRPEGKNTANFFLEADTGTMQLIEFYKKVQAYWRMHINQDQLKQYGLKEFRVITSTNSPIRQENLRQFVKEKWQQLRTPPDAKSHRRFLFTHETAYAIDNPSSILSPIYYDLRDEEPRSILPQAYL